MQELPELEVVGYDPRDDEGNPSDLDAAENEASCRIPRRLHACRRIDRRGDEHGTNYAC